MTAPLEAPPADSPDVLHVAAWPDPLLARLGHDPRSRYVETYWLGVLGPSTTLLLRLIADRFDGTEGAPFDLDLAQTAGSLGLGMRSGRQGPFLRAIDRLCQFDLARRDGDRLDVRTHLPPLTQGQLKRLPGDLQTRHAAWQRAQLVDNEVQERKARRLALTLLELGEPVDAAERQLGIWRIEGPLAQRAIIWAHDRHSRAADAATGGDAA